MTKEDSWITSYRCHCVALLRGCSVEEVFAELFGFSNGATKGKGGSMHIADFNVNMLGANGVVGANITIGAGAAHGVKLQGGDQVVVDIFGDGRDAPDFSRRPSQV